LTELVPSTGLKPLLPAAKGRLATFGKGGCVPRAPWKAALSSG